MRRLQNALLGLVFVPAMCLGRVGGATLPVEVHFDAPLHLIVLDVKIKDRGPYRFSLDSGSRNSIVDTEVANEIGLVLGNAATRRGASAQSQVTSAPVVGGVEFELAPGLATHATGVYAAPFAEVSRVMLGERLDGILGAWIFEHFVVEVDYATNTIAFHDPGEYRYDGNGAVLDLEFMPNVSRIPFVQTTLVNGARRVDFPVSLDSGGQTMATTSVGTQARWDALITPQSKIITSLGATGLSNSADGITHEVYLTRMQRNRPVVSSGKTGRGFMTPSASCRTMSRSRSSGVSSGRGRGEAVLKGSSSKPRAAEISRRVSSCGILQTPPAVGPASPRSRTPLTPEPRTQ